MDTTLIKLLILLLIELSRSPTNLQEDPSEFSMSVIALVWSRMVVLVLEGAEIVRNSTKVAGKTLAATGSVGISSPENVYERTAGSGVTYYRY